MARIYVITTGGTIEKVYSEQTGSVENLDSKIDRYFRLLRLPGAEVRTIHLMNKDSLEMTEEDRLKVLAAVRETLAEPAPIVITHGTDTMVETGLLLKRSLPALNVPIVMTGAMTPLGFEGSDGLQNLTESLLAARLLEPGVWLAMHNQVFPIDRVRKDRELAQFVLITDVQDAPNRIKEKHPLAIRWFHWISFPLLFLMIWSGLMIYWANPIYRIGWGSTTLFTFFPDWFFDFLHMPQRLAEAMALHFFFMWLFGLNGLLYVAYLLFSGAWRTMLPSKNSIREAVQVTLHDFHLSSYIPPQGKYNGAQRIAYTGIILMGAASLVTGLAIYKPSQLSWLANLLGGYEAARWQHFWLMIGFLIFFAIHIIQVALAGWNNFRSMVAGYEIVSSNEPPRA